MTTCERTAWQSDTSVRCRLGHSATGSQRVSVTTGQRGGGSMTQGLSVDLGMVSASRRSNRAATGASSVTVHGSGLGLTTYTASMGVGKTACERSTWEADTSVRCQVGRSVMGSRQVGISVGMRSGSVSSGLSVEAGMLSVVRRTNGGSTGSASVTVHGASMGLAAYTAAGAAGLTACERSTWESDTSVRCQSSHGVLGSSRVSLSLGLGVGPCGLGIDGVLCAHAFDELILAYQQSSDGLSESDTTRRKHGAGDLHIGC